jgi:hypothetical protein
MILGIGALTVVAGLTLAGCGPRRPLLPVHGRVLLDGKPLAFGSVSFQSANGQPATAAIRSDGSFVLNVIGEGSGAVKGRNRVLVTCYEGQRQAEVTSGVEMALGKPLIPERYMSYETSGIVIDIEPGMTLPIELNLAP